MKLGLLTAPFPETPLMEVADWAAAERLRGPGDRLLAAVERRRPAATPARATSTWPNLSAGQATEIVDEIAGQGPARSPASATTRTRSTRIRPTASRSSATSSTSSRAAEKMGVPLVNTFMGGDGAKNQDQNWEEALRVWPDIVRLRAGPRPEDHARELPDAVLATTSGRAATTSPRRRGCGAGSWSSGATRSGSTSTRRHLVLQMIDIRRFLKRVRAAHPPLPGQGPDDRPRRALRARRLLDGDGLADPAHPRPRRGRLAAVFSELYRAGYEGDCIIEHEDRRFEGTDEKVKQGFLIARDVLRPYCK